MKYNFYETFYLDLKVTIYFGKLNAKAAHDLGELEFYKRLEDLVKQLNEETKQYIAEKELKENED